MSESIDDLVREVTSYVTALQAENAKLRELVRDYHAFLALAELAQPIGYVVATHGSIAALDKRYRELGVEVDG